MSYTPAEWGGSPKYSIDFFDKDAVLAASAEDDAIRSKQNAVSALGLLKKSSKDAARFLSDIRCLQKIDTETIVEISIQFLEKRWTARLFAWLERIRLENPGCLIETLEEIANYSKYWNEIERIIKTDEKEYNKWVFFLKKMDALFGKMMNMEAEHKNRDAQSARFFPGFVKVYGLYLKNVRFEPVPAMKHLRNAYEEWDAAAALPYAQILLSKNRAELAEKVLEESWIGKGDIESMKLLAQIYFATNRTVLGRELFEKLKEKNVPMDAQLGEMIICFEFPRDFSALEDLWTKKGAKLFPSSDVSYIADAIEVGKYQYEPRSDELALYQLRGLQLLALEYRNYDAAVVYANHLMQLYEKGWQKKAIIREFYERYPSPRYWAAQTRANDGIAVTLDDVDLSDQEDLRFIIEDHLIQISHYALDPKKTELLETLEVFAKNNDLEELIGFTKHRRWLYNKVESAIRSRGEKFVEFYERLQNGAKSILDGEENYFGVLFFMFYNDYETEEPLFLQRGMLMAFAVAGIIYGVPKTCVIELVKRINLTEIGETNAKLMGQLLHDYDYPQESMGFLVHADLSDMEVLSSLLEIALTRDEAEFLEQCLGQRSDYNKEEPDRILRILEKKIIENQDVSIHSELLTLFAEANVIHNLPDRARPIFENAMAMGNLRAKRRVAEFCLYQSPSWQKNPSKKYVSDQKYPLDPKRALALFRELYEETEEIALLADIAQAEKAVLDLYDGEEGSEKAQELETLSPIQTLSQMLSNHPDFLPATLKVSIDGNDDVFYNACTMLMRATDEMLDVIHEDLLFEYGRRMDKEIKSIRERMEAGDPDLTAFDIKRYFTFSRTLALIYVDDIDSTLDYVGDIQCYLNNSDFELQENCLREFLHAFYSHEGDPGYSGVEVLNYKILEGEEENLELVDEIYEPLTVLLGLEMEYLEDFHIWKNRSGEFYEIAKRLFQEEHQNAALANIYAQKELEYAETQKKKIRKKKGNGAFSSTFGTTLLQ